MKESYKYVDALKLFFAVGVVIQHSVIPYIPNGNYMFFDVCIIRLSIPFFFVSSGFFFGVKIYNSGKSVKSIGGGVL